MFSKLCNICNREFVSTKFNTVWCSAECHRKLKQQKLTQVALKKRLVYLPDEGTFIWIEGWRKNKIAGCENPQGYNVINIEGVLYKSSRLAFLYMEGAIPALVDHINRKRNDDRWCNLRASNYRENTLNSNRFDRIYGSAYDT